MRLLIWFGCLSLAGCTTNSIDLDPDGGADDGGTTAGSTGAANTTTNPMTTAVDDADDDPMTTVATTSPPPDFNDVGQPPPGPSGRYLLILDSIVLPGLPLQWEVNADPDTMMLSGQSLSLDMNSTTDPRELIGGVWEVGIVVDDSATLHVDVPALQILPEANPITGGEILTDFALEGTGAGGFWCGTVTGEITQPLMLELAGSTFVLIGLDEGESYPVDFPLSC